MQHDVVLIKITINAYGAYGYSGTTALTSRPSSLSWSSCISCATISGNCFVCEWNFIIIMIVSAYYIDVVVRRVLSVLVVFNRFTTTNNRQRYQNVLLINYYEQKIIIDIKDQKLMDSVMMNLKNLLSVSKLILSCIIIQVPFSVFVLGNNIISGCMLSIYSVSLKKKHVQHQRHFYSS